MRATIGMTTNGMFDFALDAVLIGFGAILVIYALRDIFTNMANGYIKRNKEMLFNSGGTLAIKCRDLGLNLEERISIYDKYVNELGLNQTIKCTNSIVSNASNDPIKFIIKYSNIEYNKYCLEQLDFCSAFMNDLGILHDDMDELYKYVRLKLPFFINLFASESEAPYFICGIDIDITSVKNPVFCFLYMSPMGRSQNEYETEITPEIISNLQETVNTNINKREYVTIQRRAMTNDLREAIKKRDNYTCCICGNSVYKEPNLLLEVDHIIPVSKGGATEASNLQTLCWRCNREKGNNIIQQDD